MSQRVKRLAVLLYLLGLSYGTTSLALKALEVYMSKSRVYDAVQETALRAPGLRRGQAFSGIKRPTIGGNPTMVKCQGTWLPLGLAADPTGGLALTLDALSGEEAHALEEWMAPIAQVVGAEIVVTGDADGFKDVTDGSAV
jgi:hypothetical protein